MAVAADFKVKQKTSYQAGVVTNRVLLEIGGLQLLLIGTLFSACLQFLQNHVVINKYEFDFTIIFNVSLITC